MILYVQYRNLDYDYVDTRTLDSLLEDEGIIRFYRPSEKRWVNVYRDPIRGMGGDYSGPSRRKPDMTTKVKRPFNPGLQGGFNWGISVKFSSGVSVNNIALKSV
jgi:hypothetical protein